MRPPIEFFLRRFSDCLKELVRRHDPLEILLTVNLLNELREGRYEGVGFLDFLGGMEVFWVARNSVF